MDESSSSDDFDAMERVASEAAAGVPAGGSGAAGGERTMYSQIALDEVAAERDAARDEVKKLTKMHGELMKRFHLRELNQRMKRDQSSASASASASSRPTGLRRAGSMGGVPLHGMVGLGLLTTDPRAGNSSPASPLGILQPQANNGAHGGNARVRRDSEFFARPANHQRAKAPITRWTRDLSAKAPIVNPEFNVFEHQDVIDIENANAAGSSVAAASAASQ